MVDYNDNISHIFNCEDSLRLLDEYDSSYNMFSDLCNTSSFKHFNLTENEYNYLLNSNESIDLNYTQDTSISSKNKTNSLVIQSDENKNSQSELQLNDLEFSDIIFPNNISSIHNILNTNLQETKVNYNHCIPKTQVDFPNPIEYINNEFYEIIYSIKTRNGIGKKWKLSNHSPQEIHKTRKITLKLPFTIDNSSVNIQLIKQSIESDRIARLSLLERKQINHCKEMINCNILTNTNIEFYIHTFHIKNKPRIDTEYTFLITIDINNNTYPIHKFHFKARNDHKSETSVRGKMQNKMNKDFLKISLK